MVKNKKTKEKLAAKTNKTTNFLESNWIVKVTALVILIPVVIVAVLLLTSIEDSGEPVTGDRFDNHLVNEIDNKKVKEVENNLAYNNVDSVQVNLKSATLRVLIDANDAVDASGIEALANDAYNKVTAVLPVDQYFTNVASNDGTAKMYDLEIHVYNFVPTDEMGGQLYAIRYKNAPNKESGFNWVSVPKNEELTQTLLNPDANVE